MRRLDDASERSAAPIAYGMLFAGSARFRALFDEGMALLAASAAYLGGPGRAFAAGLAPPLARDYAAQAMRLTARNMQLASWLLLQRSVNAGETSREQAKAERRRTRLPEIDRDRRVHVHPEELRTIVERSLGLARRVARLDAALYGRTDIAAQPNPVARELDRIRTAFSAAA